MRGVGASLYRRRRALGALAGIGALAAGAGAGYTYSPSFRGRVDSGVVSARNRYYKARGRAGGYFPRAAFGKRVKRTRRYRFGSNPPLSNSMGYEFCSNGGGVLGANSTGLFPTPCMNVATPMAAFGRRRRVGRPRKVRRTRRRTTRRRRM